MNFDSSAIKGILECILTTNISSITTIQMFYMGFIQISKPKDYQ